MTTMCRLRTSVIHLSCVWLTMPRENTCALLLAYAQHGKPDHALPLLRRARRVVVLELSGFGLGFQRSSLGPCRGLELEL